MEFIGPKVDDKHELKQIRRFRVTRPQVEKCCMGENEFVIDQSDNLAKLLNPETIISVSGVTVKIFWLHDI